MSNERDVFNFHLNESLYFEKGQEVSQMVSISLDPDISIQPYEGYVSIRGVMELTGEYEKDPLIKQLETKTMDFTDHSHRYVEKIESTADDFAIFSHRFPVEISVPSYRINSIDDITVDVALFDYELPDINHLKVTSTISIYGIQDQSPVREDMEGGEETKESVPELQTTDHFEFELTADELNNKSEATETPDNFVEEHAEQSDASDRWKFKKTESLKSFLKKGDDDNVEVADKQSTEKTQDADLSSKNEEAHIEQSADDVVDIEEVALDLETEAKILEVAEDGDEDMNQQEDNASYLSSLFRDEESLEEDDYTQMRLCIVQDQDTLEIISERYDVSKLQLLKQNRLHDDHILTGQLLSIPARKK